MNEPVPADAPGAHESPRIAAPPRDGFPARLLDLFRSPSRLMDNVGRRPRWWAPLLVVFVTATGFSWLVTPIAAPEQIDSMRTSLFGKVMSEEDFAEMSARNVEIGPTQRVLQALADGFVASVSVILFGLVLGLFAQLSGGEVRFSQAVGVCTWGAVPAYGISLLVKLPFILMTGTVFGVATGLALLVRDLGHDSFLYKVLFNYGDFFAWWGLALIVLGFRRVFGMALGPAVLSVVLPWIVLTGIPLGIMLVMM